MLSVNLTAEGDKMVVRRNKRHNCVKCEPEQGKGTGWLSVGIRDTAVLSVNPSSGRGQDGCQEE